MEEIRMSQDSFILETKIMLMAIDKFYAECWEPKVLDDSEENICDTCNGFLYVCRGGVPDVDCPNCNGTGQNTERVFNSEKFIDFMEHKVMFGELPFMELQHCTIDNTVTGIEIVYPESDEDDRQPF